ncbi:unnamed protein product [Ixodes pacificus]
MGGNTRSPSSLAIHPTQTHTGRQSYAQPARLHASCRMRAEETNPSRHPIFHQSRTYPKKHAPHLQQGTPRSPVTCPQNPIRTLPGLFFYSLQGCFPLPPTTSPCRKRHRRPLQRTDDSYNPHYVYRDSRGARHCLAATTGDEYIIVLTDSQAACRNFLLGRISPAALKVLQNVRQLPELHIVWTPGHESFEGNEAAHAAARAHTHRAVSQEGNDTQTPCTFKPTPLQKYANILAHYRHERRQFPPPHPHLSRAEATAFRRLQTNSYSHGTLYCTPCTPPSILLHATSAPSLAPCTTWSGSVSKPHPLPPTLTPPTSSGWAS